MRYFFELGYDGADYHGWQAQPNAVSVQQRVEDALQTILRRPARITGSSRTDAGVHCVSQFFHLDWSGPLPLDPSVMRHRLNALLPHSIAIHAIRAVQPQAHARYHAIQRAYQYVIVARKNPLWAHRAHLFFRAVDIDMMNEAAALLIGEREFGAFSKTKTNVNHFICNPARASWRRDGDFLIFNIQSNRFLRGMVRALVGTLLDVGVKKMNLQRFRAILDSGDRKQASTNAPPQGLYLLGVQYPDSIFLS